MKLNKRTPTQRLIASMDARTKIKYKRIVNHLKVCLAARNHGRWYWENGEVIRYHVDYGRALTQRQLEERIDMQRQMLKNLVAYFG